MVEGGGGIPLPALILKKSVMLKCAIFGIFKYLVRMPVPQKFCSVVKPNGKFLWISDIVEAVLKLR